MSAAFELATAGRVVFGAGKVAEAPAALAALGARRPLLVTGRRGAALDGVPFAVSGEPTTEVACAGAALARAERCDAVVAFGGGSALDAGKAIAALATNDGDPLDYLEVVGRGRALARAPLPFVAIPTTAGTGSEVTRNAVLGVPEARVKASLRSPLMLPRVAIVDPDLLQGLPRPVLAAGGLDALSQLVEPFLSARANPITDALAREGIARSARSLRRAYDGGLDDAGVREDLALASLLGGLCLANAGLGAVHGFAAPLGGMFDAPHGAVCAALLPAVLEVNGRALAARAPAHPARARLDEVATIVTGNPGARAAEGVAWVRGLVQALEIPGLRRWGVSEADLLPLIERARAASSMKANPIALADEELREIVTASL